MLFLRYLRTNLKRSLIAGLLLAAAVGTLTWASVAAGTEECVLAKRQVSEATVDQAVLLALSVATASAAGFLLVLRRSQSVLAAMAFALIVALVWFIVAGTVFLSADFGHCPIGPFEM